ncbi:MAG: precorrin-6A reductase [Eubacteriales bacterium]|nr:precorrin-6A reductase [Eubacteriales bacterium]
MYKILVFAGTTEGYQLCRFLSSRGVYVHCCVATDYGSRALTESQLLKVQAARLCQEEMEALMRELAPRMVLDATHPYAAEVTENIGKACERTGFSCVRILRDSQVENGEAVYVDSPEAAVDYLNEREGNILLTTGSKELSRFAALKGFSERVYARVLSLPWVMEACKGLGLEGRHLIGMQGPFTQELNAAMLRQYQCRYLVTKDTGKAGGFQEKLDGALQAGAVPVVIGRPVKEEGLSVMECKRMLVKALGLTARPQVTLLGIGMGSRDTMTQEGKRACEEAELIIGARRMAEAVRREGQEIFCEYRSEQIASYIREHPEYDKVVVALSGDVGFYSGAKRLLECLGEDTRVICGISSVAYFMSKLRLSWEDAKIVSAHGRSCNLVSHIRHHEKVFAILGTKDGAALLAKSLTEYGMGEVELYVGEDLSYETERIFCKKARELTDYEGNPLSVVCAVNPACRKRRSTHGLLDQDFFRGKAPMTKEEIRWVSLAKLGLYQDSVCYDVGAGTGSVAVEMALRAWEGTVYAVEKKEEALQLILENKKRFAAGNLEVIRGEAPEALWGLPAPTHVFIGGSSGKLGEIVRVLLEKNPKVRMVINCITLETVSEALEVMRKYDFQETDVVQLTAARSKSVGRYHMMMGENPIYILTCQHPAAYGQKEAEEVRP